jgi:hypothetical protein
LEAFVYSIEPEDASVFAAIGFFLAADGLMVAFIPALKALPARSPPCATKRVEIAVDLLTTGPMGTTATKNPLKKHENDPLSETSGRAPAVCDCWASDPTSSAKCGGRSVKTPVLRHDPA